MKNIREGAIEFPPHNMVQHNTSGQQKKVYQVTIANLHERLYQAVRELTIVHDKLQQQQRDLVQLGIEQQYALTDVSRARNSFNHSEEGID